MRRTLTTLALIAALAFPALADDSTVLYSVSLQDLQTLLTEEGYDVTSTGDEGEVSIRAVDTDGTGLVFNLIGTACEVEGNDGCLGIHMQVRYDAYGDESLQRINDANLMWPATSAWFSELGVDDTGPTVGISRYVILDRGITVGNIKENLLNLLAISVQAADYIWQAGIYAPE